MVYSQCTLPSRNILCIDGIRLIRLHNHVQIKLLTYIKNVSLVLHQNLAFLSKKLKKGDSNNIISWTLFKGIKNICENRVNANANYIKKMK